MFTLIRTPILILTLAITSIALANAQPVLRSLVVGNGIIVAKGSTTNAYGTIGQPVIGPTLEPLRTGVLGFWSVVFRGRQPLTINNSFFTASISPNPISEESTITMTMEQGGQLRIGLYDMLGRLEQDIASGEFSVRVKTFTLNTRGMVPGMRFLVIAFNGVQTTIPVQVIR